MCITWLFLTNRNLNLCRLFMTWLKQSQQCQLDPGFVTYHQETSRYRKPPAKSPAVNQQHNLHCHSWVTFVKGQIQTPPWGKETFLYCHSGSLKSRENKQFQRLQCNQISSVFISSSTWDKKKVHIAPLSVLAGLYFSSQLPWPNNRWLEAWFGLIISWFI